MALQTRTINIDLAALVPANAVGVKVSFEPDKIAAGAGEILIKTSVSVVTGTNGITTINLPVKPSDAIRYVCTLGTGGKFGTFKFDLVAGAAINLSDLYVGGTGNYPQPVYVAIAEATSDERLTALITPLLADFETGGVDLSGYVPTSRTINTQPLTANVVIAPSNLTQTADYRFVTDIEKSAWNAKQAALNVTPENVANKSTDGTFVSNSDTLYPSQKAAKTYVDARLTAIIGTAPANLDTLQEIAAQLATDESAVSSLITTVSGKADRTLSNLTDASAARTALGLVIGTNVQAYSANLTSWAALATSAKQDALVSATNIKTINGSSILGSGDLTIPGGTTLPTYSGSGTKYLTNDGTSLAWGTVSAPDLSAYAPLANPSITSKLTINCVTVPTAPADNSAFIFENIPDPGNPGTTALNIYPKDSSDHRIYFGKTDRRVYALNFANVAQLEQVPAFSINNKFGFGEPGFAYGLDQTGAKMQMFASNNNGSAKIALSTGGVSYGSFVDRLTIDSDGVFKFWDGTQLQQMSFGANDSAGTGYRIPRFPNA